MKRRRQLQDKVVPVLTVLFAAAGFASAAQVSTSTNADATSCQYDKASVLALDYQTFDQTPGKGWRQLTSGDKCLVEAADLIREYRVSRSFPHPMLYWHEGQLRALRGSVAEAVRLMELSRPESGAITGWNEYVDVTIAFLRKDRPAFDKATTALAAMPVASFAGVVERMDRCFAKPYIQAYRVCEK